MQVNCKEGGGSAVREVSRKLLREGNGLNLNPSFSCPDWSVQRPIMALSYNTSKYHKSPPHAPRRCNPNMHPAMARRTRLLGQSPQDRTVETGNHDRVRARPRGGTRRHEEPAEPKTTPHSGHRAPNKPQGRQRPRARRGASAFPTGSIGFIGGPEEAHVSMASSTAVAGALGGAGGGDSASAALEREARRDAKARRSAHHGRLGDGGEISWREGERCHSSKHGGGATISWTTGVVAWRLNQSIGERDVSVGVCVGLEGADYPCPISKGLST